MKTPHSYYSQRHGVNPNANGLPLADVLNLFLRVFEHLRKDGYFDEAFGFCCVDAGDIEGKLGDVDLAILLDVHKKNLWPIEDKCHSYQEDDLFDVIEFLYQHVSKPIDGTMHNYNFCGMHWATFNQTEGRNEFRSKVNSVLDHYSERFELSSSGEVLRKPEAGFEAIFDADIPSKDAKVVDRISAAVLRYRRHGSTIDDRRQAVRDLADVLELLRPQLRGLLTSKDEADLFNIANNFGVRHHNDKQKTTYDAAIWLSWMFYYYLATIHAVVRKLEKKPPRKSP